MSGFSGKLMSLKVGIGASATAIANLKNTTVAFNGTQIDTTTKADDGWGSLLTGGGKRSCKITGEGTVLGTPADVAFITGCIEYESVEYTIQTGSGFAITGKWIASDFTLLGPVDGAETFSFSLENDGKITVVHTP